MTYDSMIDSIGIDMDSTSGHAGSSLHQPPEKAAMHIDDRWRDSAGVHTVGIGIGIWTREVP
jgi:hypothetical protein